MTYEEFLNSLLSGINLVFNTFGLVADNLLNNYIFITLLGITIFCSLFWFLYDTFVSCNYDNIEDYHGLSLNHQLITSNNNVEFKFNDFKKPIDTSSLSNITDKTLAEYNYYVLGYSNVDSLNYAPHEYLDSDKEAKLERFKRMHAYLFPLDTSSLTNATDKTIAEYYYYIIGLDSEQALKIAPTSYLGVEEDEKVQAYKKEHNLL